mgnify:CR=1 FL=1
MSLNFFVTYVLDTFTRAPRCLALPCASSTRPAHTETRLPFGGLRQSGHASGWQHLIAGIGEKSDERPDAAHQEVSYNQPDEKIADFLEQYDPAIAHA